MKRNCERFIDALNAVNAKNIRTRKELMENRELYADFWYAVGDFVSFVLLSKTGKKNRDGETTAGNAAKIQKLAEYGITTKEDIHTDCVIKIMDKLDRVFAQPTEKQKNYCYAICNNLVNDWFDKLPPREIKVFSLQDEINCGDDENSCTYEDTIGDYTYDGEVCFVERETLCELSEKLRQKRIAECEKERKEIIREISLLCEKPAEVMARLALVHLGAKPRELAAGILSAGAEKVYAKILYDAAKKAGLKDGELRSLLKGKRIYEGSVKEDTGNAKIIASQISHLANRAKQRL